jgi:L-iditol 2-dehydrogenase
MRTAILNGHMSAAVLYGREDLKVEQVAIPTLAEDEVLLEVKVALTCGTDLKVWKQGSHPRMIVPPAVFGHELAGVVTEVGSDVPDWVRVGMRVVPSNSAPCNACFFCLRGRQNLCEDLLFNNGAYAQFMRIPGRIVRENMLEIPDDVSLTDAAMVEPLACVLRGVDEVGALPGDTAVVIGCGPIGLMFIRMLAVRGIRVVAIGKRKSQMKAAENMGAWATFDVNEHPNPVPLVRQLTECNRGADAVVEAVGSPLTWQWAVQMARRGATVNLFGGCPQACEVRLDPAALHYSEITLKSTFHHTPRFIREALDAVARGEISATDFVTGQIALAELPRVFEHMKHRNGELKTAVIP